MRLVVRSRVCSLFFVLPSPWRTMRVSLLRDLSSLRSRLTPSTAYLLAHPVTLQTTSFSTTATASKLPSPRQTLLRISQIPHLTSSIATMASATTFYEFEPVDKKGNTFPLTSLEGKVVLVVNTASKCGFTPQFQGLEKLYQDLKAKYPEDFTIIGFPCNQFGSQDPGSNDEIQSFCQINYGVTFPVLGKLDVNGDKAAPVWTWMKEQQPGLLGLKRIKWNFEKFLISADGKVVGRWASLTKPESLEEPIVKEIEKAQKAGTLASLKKGEQQPEGEQAKLA
ncbi:thioredoxin-like protein [Aspergillus ellipticus CBS 707.79]|uniref:Glutathione peroxidase n=1 Tax=Aspergillus ellipticus CBS 707.79 TaxID=1448320 RepID=A0A319DCX4_9EURO|nr:thioredoxin-like protein [Aspergillus ellipticus CBS 707.79]